VRSVACLVVLAMIAAACTQTDADTTTTVVPNSLEADTTTTVVRNSPEAKAMIDAALGGTQAVQDFAIYLDLVLMPEDGGLESFYDDVRDQAMAGAGAPVELVDGNTLAPVDSLRGAVTDTDGVVLPTIALDFALLEASPALVEETHQTLSEVFETAGEPGLIEAFPPGSGGARLLVQIATANYTQRRTHVGPGDLAAIDLSFVDSISPGDRIASVHLFGQTLPGDPATEAGMSALELFTYRWNLGLVVMLGDDSGVTIVVDDSVTVAAGSTAGVESENRLVSADAGKTSRALYDTGQPLPLHPVDHQEANIIQVVAETGNSSPSEDGPEAWGKLVRALLKPAALLNAAIEGAQYGEEVVRLMMADALSDRATGRPAYPLPDGKSCLKLVSVEEEHRWYVGSRIDPSGPEATEDDLATGFDMHGTDSLCKPLGPADPESIVASSGLLYGQAACRVEASKLKERNDPLALAGINLSDLETICEPIVTLPRPDPDLPRTAGMFGDVHFTTFDQLIIQNQAAGEFLVFDNELATVQIRTEPWKDSETVSVATAVAARIGDHTVSIHLDPETGVGETYIESELAATDRGESVAIGGAALSWSGFGWLVVWPDGTELKVFPDTTGLVVFVTSESRSVGMFGGDGDGVEENDRVTRSGVVMSPDRSPTFWEEHYDVYVDSWRITQEESLFYYGPGESTQSYTIEGFPASYWEVSDLEGTVRDDAEEACIDGGITREDILEACILDVALTGDPAFVYSAYLVEASIPALVSPLGGSSAGPSLPGTEDMLVVGDFTFEFDAEHRFIEGTQDPVCRFDDRFSLFARTRFTAEDGAEIQFQFEYWPAAATANGQEALYMFTRNDGDFVVWAVVNPTAVSTPGASLLAGSIESVSRVDDTMTITGTAYLNEDPLFYHTYEALPAGTQFEPFTVRVTCHPS